MIRVGFQLGHKYLITCVMFVSLFYILEILVLTFFEFSYILRALFMLFFSNFLKKSLGNKTDKNSKKIQEFPTYRTIFKGICWVIRNYKYIQSKRRETNSRRVLTTQKLIEMGLISYSD